MMYKTLRDNESFTDEFPTWIIAYCLDSDTFFVTNQRYFYWESQEFRSEKEAIDYFEDNAYGFVCVRNSIISHTGGHLLCDSVYLENTKRRYK